MTQNVIGLGFAVLAVFVGGLMIGQRLGYAQGKLAGHLAGYCPFERKLKEPNTPC